MSKKRFVCIDIGYGDGWYITDDGKRLSEMEIVDLLNNLVEENEQLQRENNLLNNNEDDLKECTLENIQLKEENQELKRLIKKMGELGGFNKHLIKTICEDLE